MSKHYWIELILLGWWYIYIISTQYIVNRIGRIGTALGGGLFYINQEEERKRKKEKRKRRKKEHKKKEEEKEEEEGRKER